MDIATTAGELAPLIVIFGILSRIVTMNFNGINKLLLFVVLIVITTAYTYLDITHNIRATLIVMGILSLVSILFKILKKK